jgi:hypothetical protein
MRVLLVVTTAISAAAKKEVQRIKKAMRRISSHIELIVENRYEA